MTNQTTLGRLDVRPPEDIDSGSQRLGVFDDALRAVLGLGMSAPALPLSGYRGEMPQELHVLDDERLGDLLNNLSQWCGYIEFELAKANAAREEARARLDFIRARIRLGVKIDSDGRKLAAKDKDDQVEVDPRTVEATSRLLYTQTVYVLTKVLLEKSQRDWDTVSRRITQRGQDVERMKREGNVAGVSNPVPSRTFNRPRHYPQP